MQNEFHLSESQQKQSSRTAYHSVIPVSSTGQALNLSQDPRIQGHPRYIRMEAKGGHGGRTRHYVDKR